MTDDMTNELAIRAMLDRWAHAACAGDMEGVLADHAEDILMFDVPLPLQSAGIAAYRRTWELFFASNEAGPHRFVLRDVKVLAGRDVGVAYGVLEIGGAALCRLTVAFQRAPHGWRVVHEHHSMPV